MRVFLGAAEDVEHDGLRNTGRQLDGRWDNVEDGKELGAELRHGWYGLDPEMARVVSGTG